MAVSRTTFVPGPDELLQQVAGSGRVTDRFDPHHYEKQVARGAPWDTGYAFRLATARAKDKARTKLVRAIRLEAKQMKSASYTTLGADYLTRDHGINTFIGEAHANVVRSIDGVRDAPDDAIKL